MRTHYLSDTVSAGPDTENFRASALPIAGAPSRPGRRSRRPRIAGQQTHVKNCNGRIAGLEARCGPLRGSPRTLRRDYECSRAWLLTSLDD
jgi:hypothetical protein